jgi:threonine dehydrogenase-like Zn-dependent dehydrogenase
VIGLGVIQVLRALSAPNMIIAIDFSEKRLTMARELGADAAINAASQDIYQTVFDLIGSRPSSLESWLASGADITFDCAGASREDGGASSLQQALMITKEKGRVVLLSLSERPVGIEPNIIMRKSLSLIGSYGSTSDDFGEALDSCEHARSSGRGPSFMSFPSIRLDKPMRRNSARERLSRCCSSREDAA